MVITYYGLSCFKIQSGDTVLAIDPFSKESGLTPPRFGADAVLVSHEHENHNNIDALTVKDGEASLNSARQGGVFKVTGPGEYEFKGILVRGTECFHDSKNGKQKGKNTIYIIEWDGSSKTYNNEFPIVGSFPLTGAIVSNIPYFFDEVGYIYKYSGGSFEAARVKTKPRKFRRAKIW